MTNEEVIAKTKEEITLRGLSKATADEYLKSLRVFCGITTTNQLSK